MMIFIAARTKTTCYPESKTQISVRQRRGVARNCAAALVTSGAAGRRFIPLYELTAGSSVRSSARPLASVVNHHIMRATTTRATWNGHKHKAHRCHRCARRRPPKDCRTNEQQRGIGHILNEISLFSGAAHYGRCKM